MIYARRLFGVAGIAVLVLAALGACTAKVGATFIGAAGDRVDRIMIGLVVAIVAGIGAAVIGFEDWPIASIRRSPWFYGFSAVIIALVAWGALGIDSTRAVRALPEAHLAYPGAVEIGRWAKPVDASLDSSRSAELGVSFSTTDSYAAVEAFYRAELVKRGWVYSWTFGSPGRDDKYINWKRDEFTFQLQLLSPNPRATPGFTTVIYGRPR